MRRAVLLAVAAAALAGCREASHDRTARLLTGGDPAHGRTAVRAYGCDTCHTIPGILSADATVGPPLDRLARRTYLAGRVTNTPENLIRFIRDPRSVDERTAMPATGVTERDGRDIAAFLYTLQ
jgi:cytochrome c2